MSIMRKLTRGMWNEVEGAKKYTEHAVFYKTTYPEVADMYMSMAKQELEHSKKFYEHAMKLAKMEVQKSEQHIDNWLKESWNEELNDYMECIAKVEYMMKMYSI